MGQAQGLIWVWGAPGGPGSDAAIQASLKAPALIPELEDPALKGRVKRLTWSVRDLPYGWDYFIENVLDPAHVAVSHHGKEREERERGEGKKEREEEGERRRDRQR